MIYTQQRRKAMNKAVCALYPHIEFYEPSGVPVMECNELPEGAVRVINADDFLRKVNGHCCKTDALGRSITDYGKALPVFIHSMELDGRGITYFYRVNYVSMSESSQQRAAHYIAEGKLYAVM